MTNLNPVVACVVGKEGGLPMDKRIVVTTAAMLINGPLALAPALVAVERQRTQGPSVGGSDPDASGEIIGPVGPPLVEVPPLRGQTVGDAEGKLRWC